MRTREEQIADLENQFGEEGTFAFVDDRDAATKHIIEAERRGYERARAECAADTRRIEYFNRYKTKAISRWNDNLGRYEWSVQLDKWYPTFRAAIDAAMEGGNG